MSVAHAGRRWAGAQHGASLIVVLLLLLVVTLLGLAAMRSTLLQERMAGNMVARGEAFQSAEAALREAEAFAATLPTPPGAGCSAGVCAMTKGGAAPAWQATGFWNSASNYRTASGTGAAGSKYVVEDYGQAESSSCTASIDMSAPPCTNARQVYRITVVNQPASGAQVVLQSTFEVPIP